ncbi:hypothetical protein FGG08_005396 [Glutinoglossum americanum]|uniref:Heterokaryon incompatibility domain-containing protein n=1 Tax=Glutinoglossum americanum TaxID=1670608 RepID=A0A9P8L1G6_9PEZI|nr:hypothetical protein FGG08_005396 [Glutinoglossum americanum]
MAVNPLNSFATLNKEILPTMRLLHCKTFQLESHDDPTTRPPYAIFSHRWGREEVLYDDIRDQPHAVDFVVLQEYIQGLEKELNELKCHLRVAKGTGGAADSRGVRVGDGENIVGGGAIDLRLHRAKKKEGWAKIEGCCAEASRLGFTYVWIDTCCINKDSSTELSEAINSMFVWYREADLCLAYLEDYTYSSPTPYIPEPIQRGTSQWFTRGWTLQELIAPREVVFYNKYWTFIGCRTSLADIISGLTGISAKILSPRSGAHLSDFSVATRLSWAAGRKTTRGEDRSYSLLGLLGVSMPIIYGEGEEAAFFRLQTEIFRSSSDHSIFAWRGDVSQKNKKVFRDPTFSKDGHTPEPLHIHPSSSETIFERSVSLLARSPDNFKHSSNIYNVPYTPEDLVAFSSPPDGAGALQKYSHVTQAMRVQLPLEPLIITPSEPNDFQSAFLAHLACKTESGVDRVAILLEPGGPGVYRRAAVYELIFVKDTDILHSTVTLQDVYVPSPSPLLPIHQPAMHLDPAVLVRRIRVHLVASEAQKSGFMMSGSYPDLPPEEADRASLRSKVIGPTEWKFSYLTNRDSDVGFIFQGHSVGEFVANAGFVIVFRANSQSCEREDQILVFDLGDVRQLYGEADTSVQILQACRKMWFSDQRFGCVPTEKSQLLVMPLRCGKHVLINTFVEEGKGISLPDKGIRVNVIIKGGLGGIEHRSDCMGAELDRMKWDCQIEERLE